MRKSEQHKSTGRERRDTTPIGLLRRQLYAHEKRCVGLQKWVLGGIGTTLLWLLTHSKEFDSILAKTITGLAR